MSVTLDDVKLARKRAYDRVDYWLQKYQGVTIHEAGISIPRIPKDLHPSEYGDWYDYFEGFTGAEEHGGTEDYVFDEYEPPELDSEYHPKAEPEPIPEPEPEPIEEFPDEPWWDDYEEDEEDEYEPSEPEPDPYDESGYEDIDFDWYDWQEEAPEPIDIEDLIKQRANDISPEAGDAIDEALNNIKEQYDNIGDSDGYYSGLENMFTDDFLWDNLQRSERYRAQSDGGGSAISELGRALSKTYKHFGMTYYREY